MDFSAIIGLISGLVLIYLGIAGSGSITNFLSLEGALIVFGGTAAAILISSPISLLKEVPNHLKIISKRNKYNPQDYIDKIVDYAQEARKRGLLTLEDKANKEDDDFLKESIMLIVDAIEPSKAQEMLENELYCLEQRHMQGWQMYDRAAAFSPAFGMVGTLVGLINMLKSLGSMGSSGDAAANLGTGMSYALITTFYGAAMANLIFSPIAYKLRAKHNEEMVCKEIIVEGVLAIHSGTNPRLIEERLKAHLNEKKRIDKNSKSGNKTNLVKNKGKAVKK